ncbi:PTS sugar transporter subunit IIA [Caldithrix abyssi]
MSEKIFAAIITHGELACALADVAENLTVAEIPLHCYSTKILSSEEIIDRLEKEIERESPQKVLLFVDLIGGGCWIIANKLKKNNDNINIIAGVNVPMIISFMINFKRLTWAELLEKVAGDAQKGVVIR